jgi:opacity protein-like surface antigen
MKRINQILTLFCLSLILCTPAVAQHSGPYVGGYFGGSMLTEAKSTDKQGDFSLTFDPASMFSGVAGWELEPGHPLGEGRVELEYARRSNKLTKAKFVEGSVKADGTVISDSLLFNCIGVFRDKSSMTPYAGAGVGAARIESNNLTITGQPFSSGSKVVLAYQLLAGLDFALSEQVTLDLGYRFLGCSAPKFTETGGQKYTMDYYSHTVILGVRLGF